MTRTCRLAALSLMAALFTAAPALAQQGRGGMGGGMGMVGPGIVAYPAVQKELKLTDEQAEKARTFAQDYQAKMRESMTGLQDLDQSERMQKMQEIARKHSAEGMKEVEGMLKPEQTARLKQIIFQARGIDAFSDPEVAKELAITPDQKDKVGNLVETMRSENRAAMQDANGDRQAAAAKQAKIRKETLAKALALMTPEQVAKVKTMTGEPFELPAMGGGGRRPGGNN